MKWVWLAMVGGLVGVMAGALIVNQSINLAISNAKSITPTPVPTPLYKYSIENLNLAPEGKLTVNEDDTFIFEIGGLRKKTTGQIHFPPLGWKGKRPVVVMWRGYQDVNTYQTGFGTQRVAAELARAGYITVAPDFLGYAASDAAAADIFEARFQSYWTAVSLLKSLGQLDQWDKKNVFMWAHSNGGQVALQVLEATGREIPTILWAPVSKGFPYSALVYTDQSDDGGKLIRGELSKFESIYDVDKFSVDKYLDRIKAPMLVQQGTADTDVPYWWSDGLVKRLKVQEVKVEYVKYPGADHNLQPSWNWAVHRDVQWIESMIN